MPSVHLMPLSNLLASLNQQSIASNLCLDHLAACRRLSSMMPNTTAPTTRLEEMNVKELKNLLKLEGLPVGGNKSDLIARLRAYSGKPKPEVDWQYSTAKKKLKKQLLDSSSSVHKMTAEEVWHSDPDYTQYPMFLSYLESLKKRVNDEKKAVKEDDKIADLYYVHFPRNALNKRGYPHWDGHRAAELLAADIENNLHIGKSANKLRATREEYKEFPKDVFSHRLYNEKTKHKAKGFWVHGRNKKGMKKYLQRAE